jgi:3-hydroxyisobutyrate dehydrogenase
MKLNPQDSIVGLIGTGVMGKSMAGHLLAGGYRLHIHTRTAEKAQALLASGAQWQPSPQALAAACDAIITMVGFPDEVEALYFAPQGLLAHAREGTVLIDMSTSRPELAQRIYAAAQARGVHALDAPVSGGDLGARQATLSIMVGGDEAVYEQARPLLEQLGKNIVYQGPAGHGQHTKLANQIAIAAGMIAATEALLYAQKAGLEPEKVLQSIEKGAAGSWTLSHLVPRMIRGDFAPGFYVKHFIKDLTIALESAQQMALKVPGLELTKTLYEQLAAQGGADWGTQAIYTLLKNLSEEEVPTSEAPPSSTPPA